MSPDSMQNMGTFPASPFAGRYTIERELGRGGMAIVYLARDLSLDRHVAVKILHRDLATHLGGGRFTREIRITSQLRHPGILTLLDSGEQDGVPYYTMPFVDGPTLAQRIQKEHQLPIDVAIRYAVEIAEALTHAHGSGFLHRDLKPSNVLLVSDHTVLADFGIARAMDASAHDSLTDSGLAVGTAQYMSPEQASADTVDQRSDVYALGCLLYEMLAGAPPFTGVTTQAILARHMVDAVPKLRTVRTSVNAATERVIERALAKVPADRFATAAEFREALVVAQTAKDEMDPRTVRNRALTATGGAAVIAIAVAWWMLRVPPLDPNRVVGFPLSVTASVSDSPTAGEDVLTLIGSALDRRGMLRWVDGWSLLDDAQRKRAIDPSRAKSIAMAQRARYYVTGSVVPKMDSAHIDVYLKDVLTDSTVAHGRATRPNADWVQATSEAITQILPSLVPAGQVGDVAPAWQGRDPGAIASFLRGEAAFRRSRYSEALQYFREAVGIDSAFAFAAVRGAQAATANDRPAEAAELVHAAVGKPMLAQYAAFTRGYIAYLAGNADSAVKEFRAAIARDHDMTSAWAQLGETYIHLVPSGGNVDSLASIAFDSARARDPSSTNYIFHPAEIALRRGEARAVAPLVERFLASKPDSALAVELQLASDCIRNGTESADWGSAVRRSPRGVVSVGLVLSGAGTQLPCSAAAYAAVIDRDTARTDASSNNRASALVGLVSVLVAQGKVDEARTRIENSVARGDGGASLLLFAAPVAPQLNKSADAVALKDSTRFAPAYTKCTTTERCWLLAAYEASRGHTSNVSAIADVLRKRTTPDSTVYVRNLVLAAAAHAQLARGDSAGARNAFATLLAQPQATASSLAWYPGGPLGIERLTYARLLMAANQPAQALAVASALDALPAAGLPLYLRASLELRALASEKLGNRRGAQEYRDRLAALSTTSGR